MGPKRTEKTTVSERVVGAAFALCLSQKKILIVVVVVAAAAAAAAVVVVCFACSAKRNRNAIAYRAKQNGPAPRHFKLSSPGSIIRLLQKSTTTKHKQGAAEVVLMIITLRGKLQCPGTQFAQRSRHVAFALEDRTAFKTAAMQALRRWADLGVAAASLLFCFPPLRKYLVITYTIRMNRPCPPTTTW